MLLCIGGHRVIKVRKLIITVVFAAVLLVVLMICFIDIVPKKDRTQTDLVVLEQRIRHYYEKNGMLPTSLAELPEAPSKENRVTDGWGRPIIYKHVNGKVFLLSYGKDGLPGGSGDDEDITRTFSLRVESASP